jgi:hypothetical protein
MKTVDWTLCANLLIDKGPRSFDNCGRLDVLDVSQVIDWLTSQVTLCVHVAVAPVDDCVNTTDEALILERKQLY